jgi:hypothetical protein
MNILKKTFLLVGALLGAQIVYSQEAIPVSGGEANGPGGSVSYTVGQVFYTTYTGSTGSVSQGVQQPYEFQVIINSKLKNINLTAVTYPNPTKDFIILKITDSAFNNLRYTLFDANVKFIASDAISASRTQIQMKYLTIGVYILKVSKKNKILKTFKIIKHH